MDPDPIFQTGRGVVELEPMPEPDGSFSPPEMPATEPRSAGEGAEMIFGGADIQPFDATMEEPTGEESEEMPAGSMENAVPAPSEPGELPFGDMAEPTLSAPGDFPVFPMTRTQ